MKTAKNAEFSEILHREQFHEYKMKWNEKYRTVAKKIMIGTRGIFSYSEINRIDLYRVRLIVHGNSIEISSSGEIQRMLLRR